MSPPGREPVQLVAISSTSRSAREPVSPPVSPALDWPRLSKVGPVQLVAFGPP